MPWKQFVNFCVGILTVTNMYPSSFLDCSTDVEERGECRVHGDDSPRWDARGAEDAGEAALHVHISNYWVNKKTRRLTNVAAMEPGDLVVARQ